MQKTVCGIVGNRVSARLLEISFVQKHMSTARTDSSLEYPIGCLDSAEDSAMVENFQDKWSCDLRPGPLPKLSTVV